MVAAHGFGNGIPPTPTSWPFLQGALLIGNLAFETGDFRGCYELFACASRLILATTPGQNDLRERLTHGLEQSALLGTARKQADHLRQIVATMRGASPAPAPQGEPLDVMRSYLALAIQLGAPVYNTGDHHGCYETYACTARLLLQIVAGADVDKAKSQLREALQQCAPLNDANRQAWIMRHAFDAILGAEEANPLDMIRGFINMAIQIGAPAYNRGDHRGCFEVYACTARMLLLEIQGAGEAKGLLRAALKRCDAMTDMTQRAWTMRHAFDAILDEEEDED